MTTYLELNEKQKISEQRAADIRLKNNRLGMQIFQISWIMAFIAMIVVNWQLRFNYSQWPPLGVPPLDPLLPSAATLALLISSACVMRALKSLRLGSVASFLKFWRRAIGLGLLFMATIVYEFLTVSEAAMATQYGITFRLMTGFHFVHALAIMALMLRVRQGALSGRYSSDEHSSWTVEGAAKLWYFVAFAWVLFYIVLYWIR